MNMNELLRRDVIQMIGLGGAGLPRITNSESCPCRTIGKSFLEDLLLVLSFRRAICRHCSACFREPRKK